MSGPGAGFEYPPSEVSWLKRDVLLFANSIGCTADELHFLYVQLPMDPAAETLMLTPLPGTSSQLQRLPDLRNGPPYVDPFE